MRNYTRDKHCYSQRKKYSIKKIAMVVFNKNVMDVLQTKRAKNNPRKPDTKISGNFCCFDMSY